MRALCSIVLSLAVAHSAAAAILHVNDDGQLTGASDVDVGGILYDVTFGPGSCVSRLDGCDEQSDLTFHSLEAAKAASRALLEQVLIDTVLGAFDTQPELTYGCSDLLVCEIHTPFLLSGTGTGTGRRVDASRAQNGGTVAIPDTVSRGALVYGSFTQLGIGQHTGTIWADWSPSPPSAVSEPGAFSLLLLGLGAIGASRVGKRGSF